MSPEMFDSALRILVVTLFSVIILGFVVIFGGFIYVALDIIKKEVKNEQK